MLPHKFVLGLLQRLVSQFNGLILRLSGIVLLRPAISTWSSIEARLYFMTGQGLIVLLPLGSMKFLFLFAPMS